MKTVINPKPDSWSVYIRKIVDYRSVISVLAIRDLKIKYAQTLIGVGWTLAQPLASTIIFTLFFTAVFNVKSPYPYILFVMSGVIVWGLFNYIFSHAGTSLTNSQGVMKKMYFPKIIIPVSKTIPGLIECGITSMVFVVIFLYCNVPNALSLLWLPVIFIPVVLFSLGLGLMLAAATVKHRDLFHIIPFIVNSGIWITPVFYPLTLIPEAYRNMLFINPVAANIQLLRNVLFNDPLNEFVYAGLVLSLLFFIAGIAWFRRVEDKINDML